MSTPSALTDAQRRVQLTTLLDGDTLAAVNTILARYGCPTATAPCTVGQALAMALPMRLDAWCQMVADLTAAITAAPAEEAQP